MCGIAGILSSLPDAHDQQALRNMTDALEHRGPDDSGIWSDAEAGISLCHRRLSILDITRAGHQPMRSARDRYRIIYNGEIYNHLELREDLKQQNRHPNWVGHSDTETILAAIEAWGLQNTLCRLNGMYAFALWDRQERILTLVRDKMGEKPLYYGWLGGIFFFASELKALKKHPLFRSEISRDVLTLYLRHSYVPTPYSIYRGISKLAPGTSVSYSLKERESIPQPYWSLQSIVTEGQQFAGTEKEAVDQLENVLLKAVRSQMISDVPIGAFLSGGIDSSTITALMQSQSTHPVKTFTIGFREQDYNEAEQAKAIAKHLGTEHTEHYVSAQDAMDIIPDLPSTYDEPFSDASQIPTCLVSRLTRKQVTVALSGDAGDELFGGYNRYFWINPLWRKLGYLPVFFRQLGAKGMHALSPSTWNTVFGYISRVFPKSFRVSLPGDKMHKLANVIAAPTPEKIYLGLVSHWNQPTEVVLNANEPSTRLTDIYRTNQYDLEHRMMFLDSISYLPDDILVKVDRAAMSSSLETRVPFLDSRVIEYAWNLPLNMKIRNGQGKWILREVLKRYVPEPLIDRPKMGFGLPLDEWLRGPLKDWAEDLIEPSRLQQEGFFNPEPIRKKWNQHISGQYNWQYHIWDILMFQSWLQQEKENA